MSGIDTIVMMDWSGVNDRGPRPKADAIWSATCRMDAAGGGAEPPVYHRSIAAAETWLRDLIGREGLVGRRLLVGLDFPFGYPEGAGRRIAGSDDPRALWAFFADAFAALGEGEGRFHIAARLNALWPGDGPFWFNGLKTDLGGLPRTRPAALPEGVPERRAADQAAPGAFTCWQMGGAGAVGSQAMTGMALIGRLRRDLQQVTVWPFEAPGAVHLVEIWPSLFGDAVARAMDDPSLPRDGGGRPIKDAAQVLGAVREVAAAARDGRLERWLAAAPASARQAEGWILGAGAEEPAGDAPLDPPPLSNDCFALPPGVAWTPVDEALQLLRDRLQPLTGVERVALAAADGRILAADAVARRANPPGANAAVDGFGFASETAGAGLQRLPLVAGRAAAGAPFGGVVDPGRAIRILTGALLPRGVDTVVLEEDTTTDGASVAFHGPVRCGANTRRAGEDVDAGATALRAGHVLRPVDLALLAAVGVAEVPVRRRLRVGVLSTGDELAAPGATEDPARTFDANRPMLLALLRRWGHVPVDLGLVPDDRARLRTALDNAAADVVLTSGGASAGDEDHVSALLAEEGALAAWRIALKPGRPLALGMRGTMPIFGLPGNPVASLVCTLIFAHPALSVLAGGKWLEPLALSLPAAFEKDKKPGRREYLRARIGPRGVETFASEGSGRISGLAWAEGLVDLGDAAATIRMGDPVRFLPYAGFGFG